MTHYIKIYTANQQLVENYAQEQQIHLSLISVDFGGTSMYIADISPEEAVALKLALPLIGCVSLDILRQEIKRTRVSKRG
jgi:hypothetical protein